jgi:hypothetical protein
MALHALDRKLLIVPFTVCAQDFQAARAETAAETMTTFIVPWNGIIRGLMLGMGTLAGTTKTWIVTIQNAATTVLATSGTITDTVLAIRTTGLNIPVTANQVLTVSHAFGHTDCVAEGALVVVEFQILPDLE